jgi:hypothetical protein
MDCYLVLQYLLIIQTERKDRKIMKKICRINSGGYGVPA